MTSSDREILLSINGQLQVLGERVTRIEQTQALILQRQDNLDDKLVDLKSYTNTWFTVIAIVIGIVGALSPLLQRKDSPSVIAVNSPDVNDIARRVAEINRKEQQA